MEQLNHNEHVQCFYYDSSNRARIELAHYAKGHSDTLALNSNHIIFFLKGKMRLSFHHDPETEEKGGKMLFLPAGYNCSYYAVTEADVLIFRLYQPIKLCENYFVENLFKQDNLFEKMSSTQSEYTGYLTINRPIASFLQGLADRITDGIKCRHFFDMKIREYFLLLRAYYPKEDIHNFFHPILSRDTAFSEYVRNHRNMYPTVIALAESMHLTQKQFSRKFKEIFGQTAYNWMKEGKVETIQYEICSGKKPFKQIAMENGFGTLSQFNKFCKKEIGGNPMDLRYSGAASNAAR